jgi:hypothetical protein
MMRFADSNVYVDTYGGSLWLYEPDEYAAPPLLKKYGSRFVASDE